MRHSEVIRKLANAVKAYRGRSHPIREGQAEKEWIIPPQPDKIKRIRELLTMLWIRGQDQEKTIEKIDGFKNINEFDSWISDL